MKYNLNTIIINAETRKMAHDSQLVRAKVNFNLSHGGHNQR